MFKILPYEQSLGSVAACELAGNSIRLTDFAVTQDVLPVFKTGARYLRGSEGVFDSHTLPPYFSIAHASACRCETLGGGKEMNDGQFIVFCPQCEIDIGSGDHEAAIRIANEHEKKSIGQHKPEIIGKQPPPKRG